jgi:hypothetical protein
MIQGISPHTFVKVTRPVVVFKPMFKCRDTLLLLASQYAKSRVPLLHARAKA